MQSNLFLPQIYENSRPVKKIDIQYLIRKLLFGTRTSLKLMLNVAKSKLAMNCYQNYYLKIVLENYHTRITTKPLYIFGTAFIRCVHIFGFVLLSSLHRPFCAGPSTCWGNNCDCLCTPQSPPDGVLHTPRLLTRCKHHHVTKLI